MLHVYQLQLIYILKNSTSITDTISSVINIHLYSFLVQHIVSYRSLFPPLIPDIHLITTSIIKAEAKESENTNNVVTGNHKYF